MRLLARLCATALLCLVALASAHATISSSANKTIVSGNGAQTVFTFGFVADSSPDIYVIYTDASGNQTTLTQGPGPTQYQVTLNGALSPALWGVGGSITYNPNGTPIAAGTTLTIYRELPYTQTTSLQNQASFGQYAQAAEMGLDSLAMQIQQIAEAQSRVVSAPIVDPPGINLTLPPAAQRAGMALCFDDDGNVIACSTLPSGIVSSAMQPVVSAASLAAGRTAFGLGQLATEDFGPGLADNGYGASPVWQTVAVSTNQSPTASNHLTSYECTGPVTFTLARADTLFNGYGFWVAAFGQPCILTPNSNDAFVGQATGASLSVPPGSSVFVSTNAATNGTWYASWSSSGPTAARTKLTAATGFYVDPVNGTDQIGCGLASGTAACNTRQYLVDILYANYDTGGQTVTVNLAHGTYTHGLSMSGLLVGQTGPTGLVFTGDCSSAANTQLALIQPTVQANSYALAYGAAATIQCQKVDHSKILSVSGGADMISVGQGASVVLGDAALYCPGDVCSNGYADLTFGCNINPWNSVTGAFRAYVGIVNDFNIDQTSCLVATTATVTSGSGVLTNVGTTTGLVQYMGIAGSDIPTDAFVETFTSNSVTMGCIYTSPCQASASSGGVSFDFFGGGQSFIDLGNGSQLYVNTNGDPSYSIIANFVQYNYFYAGFFFDNDLSAMNAGAITFAEWGQAHGACVTVEGLSVFTSYGEGSPYIPCNATSPVANTGMTTTAGSQTVTVTSSSGFNVGDVISNVAVPECTWTAGSATISCSSATDLVTGAYALAAGILSGARITGVSGTNVTLGGCGSGPRCVSGNPTYLTESTAVPVYFKGGCLQSGTKVTSVPSGTSLTISEPALNSCSSVFVWATAFAQDNSIYQ